MGVFRKISHEGCAAHCYFQKGRLIEESSMKSEKKFRAQKTTVKQLWVVSLLSFMTANPHTLEDGSRLSDNVLSKQDLLGDYLSVNQHVLS